MHSSTGWLTRVAVRLALPGLVLAITGAGAPPMAAAGSFQAVGSMAEGLYDPVVVTLADGSALVTGGWKYDDNGENAYGTSLAERFDPVTNQFTKLSPMGEAHMSHAAVVLADGRVVLVGGTTGLRDQDTDVLDAEVYDPGTGSFTRTGKMAALRGNPTASLLPDGRVLVAGGWTPLDPAPPSVEFFDPATGQFTAGPNLLVRRYRHSAVTLPDSRVVLLGGARVDTGDVIKAVEIYDPQHASFSPAGSLVEARHTAQATLLSDGRVLIAGGHGANGRLDSVEIYDPGTGKSTVVAHFPKPVGENGLVMLRDGRILSTGGIGGPLPGGEFTPAAPSVGDLLPAWLIMPGTFEIVPAAPMVQPRDIPDTALLGDGRALILGGLGFDANGKFGPLASAEVFVP
jgi:hypothetical protein